MYCSSSSPLLSFTFFSIFLFSIFSSIAQAIVLLSKMFKFINQGEFGDHIVEYDGSYRVLDVFTFPFTLCFYNTTPNAFTLALNMGVPRSKSVMRWVWEANRGKPVREHATLTFGNDGNLVLADADGRVAWHTDTANKGVVGLKLLPNGNMVLHDSKGGLVWQSFDSPTDTLLVGQALRQSGPTRLISRVSDIDGSEGPYSFVIEQNRLAMYLKSKNSPKPRIYYASKEFTLSGTHIVFSCAPETDEAYVYELKYDLYENSSSVGSLILGRPKYNSTLSILRLGFDGNLKLYTYDDKVNTGAWEVTYYLFDRDCSNTCEPPGFLHARVRPL